VFRHEIINLCIRRNLLTGLMPAAIAQQTITGQAAFADWNQQQPGLRRKITLADLPQPKPDEAADNTPTVIPRPRDAWPLAPAGFKVTLYAGGDSAPMQRADNTRVMTLSGGTFTMPRLIRTAPNGDLILADSGAGILFVLRGIGPDGKTAQIEKFATGLDLVIALDGKRILIANDSDLLRAILSRRQIQADAHVPEALLITGFDTSAIRPSFLRWTAIVDGLDKAPSANGANPEDGNPQLLSKNIASLGKSFNKWSAERFTSRQDGELVRQTVNYVF
jgi:hypothetical protein